MNRQGGGQTGSEARARSLLVRLDDFEDAEGIADEADRLLQDPPLPVVAEILSRLARGLALHRLDRTEAALRDLHWAALMSESESRSDLVIRANATIASLHAWRGRFDEALTHLALALAEAASCEDRVAIAGLCGDCGRIHLEAGQAGAARSFFRKQAKLLDASASPRDHLRFRLGLIEAEIESGALEEAQVLLSELTDADTGGSGYLAFRVVKARARLAFERGRNAEARQIATNAIARIELAPGSYEVIMLEAIVASADARDGRAAAEPVLARLADLLSERRLIAPAIDLRLEQARLLTDLSREGEALAAVGKALTAAVASGSVALERKVRETLALIGPVSGLGIDTRRDAAMFAAEGYILIERLGRGGFATVFRAFDLVRGREVALKRFHLPDQYDQDMRRSAIETARAELDATQGFHHPGVARALAFAIDRNGSPYLAQELVEGDSVADLVAAQSLALREGILLVGRIAQVLSALHSCGLVHRDLKPANILCRSTGEPVIVDFGLATLAGTQGILGGTEAYAAPEQQQAEPAGPAADCFALGVMAVEILTGMRPAGLEDRVRLWPFGQHDPLGPAVAQRLVERGIDLAIRDLLFALLSPDPSERPAAEAVARAFMAAAATPTPKSKAGSPS